jgi:ABC-type antimicrobial peptide transport system permease subunit
VNGVALLQTDVRYAGYSPAEAASATEELRRRVAAIAGVQSTALTRGLPMETVGVPVIIEAAVPADPHAPPRFAGAIWAGPHYFDVLQIPILFGRALDERDRSDRPRVAVISETMARQYFGVSSAADAVGRRFRNANDDGNGWIEVVGVARDTGTADLQGDLIDPTPQLFYRSFAQWEMAPTTVIARSSSDASSLVGAMQRELRGLNSALPIISAQTMAQYLDTSLAAPRAIVAFFAALGVVGVSLAGIGLYAVVAFAVARRTREIGIRMALGARSSQVVWNVLRDVAVLVGAGTAIGLGVSLLAMMALRATVVTTPGLAVYRPTPEPLALLSIAAFMAFVALTAAGLPARRAATTDPLAALRQE